MVSQLAQWAQFWGFPRISHSTVRGAGINEDVKDVALSIMSQGTGDRQGFEQFRADEIDHHNFCQRDGYRRRQILTVATMQPMKASPNAVHGER
jgi:hypothetical protein